MNFFHSSWMFWLVVLLAGVLASCGSSENPTDTSKSTPPVQVRAWVSVETLGGTIGTDLDIVFSRSTDGGKTWSAAAALNTNAASDTDTSGGYLALATDGKGVWVAVWDSDEDLGATIGTDLDLLFARSTDNGATWSAPAVLNTNAASDTGGDSEPTILSDGNGKWVAVWRSTEDIASSGTDNDIVYARSTDNGETWSAPAVLNSNATVDDALSNDGHPSLATDGQGNWGVVWTAARSFGTDMEVYFSRSVDHGVNWSTLIPLNDTANADNEGSPTLRTDKAGNWIAAWMSTEDIASAGTDHDILFVRSTDNGQTWTATAPLNTNADSDTGTDSDVSIATNGPAGWVAIWTSNDTLGATIGGDDDILVARSGDGGATWSTPVALNSNAATDAGNDWYPTLSSNGAGNWVAGWESNEDLVANPGDPGDIGTDYDALFAHSSDTGTTWSAPAALNSYAETDAGGEDLWFVIGASMP